MKARLAFVLVTVAAAVALIAFHFRLRSRIAAASDEAASLGSRAHVLALRNAELQQEIEAGRAKVAGLRRPKAAAPATTANRTPAPTSQLIAGTEGSVVRVQTAVIADTPDLRQIQVRAYVGERRMFFAGCLHQLGLTPEQLQRFDAIHAEYQQGVLDVVSSATAQGVGGGASLAPLRQQLIDTRDAQLRELFGEKYPAWEEATRTQGARAAVGQLLQQTFPSVGPIENAQTEQLVAIFARHAQPAAPGGYAWSALSGEASTVLNARQFEAFQTAFTFRRLNEEAQALAANRH